MINDKSSIINTVDLDQFNRFIDTTSTSMINDYFENFQMHML